MSLKLNPAMICMAATLTFGLAACGGNGASSNASGSSSETTKTGADGAKKAAGASSALTLAAGPDVCFRAIADHLGKDVKVSEITSFFSAGSEVDGNSRKPEGEMTTCTVQYQSPDDARKLVSTSMDTSTGVFSEPRPVEIRVTGGSAAEFKLDDYLIPLSKVNAAALTGIMDAQKARLGGVFSKYAWSGVRLSSPGPFSDVHTLRLDVDGRLASNDIKEDGYASIAVDGQKIVTDHLIPS